MVIDRSPMEEMRQHFWHPYHSKWGTPVWICGYCETKVKSTSYPNHLDGRVLAGRPTYSKPVALDLSMYCGEVLAEAIMNEAEDVG